MAMQPRLLPWRLYVFVLRQITLFLFLLTFTREPSVRLDPRSIQTLDAFSITPNPDSNIKGECYWYNSTSGPRKPHPAAQEKLPKILKRHLLTLTWFLTQSAYLLSLRAS